ncbi:MAG TPA: hypothetical protein VFL61_10230, partial [Gaiellaceae bacterium]|nr:hypothetical protein [Gaiellaceae bacterium]
MAGLEPARSARRAWYPLHFATRRVAAARRSVSIAAFGVALASCALAVAFAASAIVENRAVADAIDELPADARDVEVSWVGLTDVASEPLAEIDRRTRAALDTVGLEPRDRTLVYRDTRLEGQAVRIAAADRLERWFVLRRGRLPRPCTPQRCETVAVAGDRVPEVHGF